MAKFVFLYEGGTYPETEEEQATVMAAWSEWLGSAGDNLLDGGAPLGQKRTVGSDGSVSDGGSGINGYSVIEADSLDAAVDFARRSPHLTAGGSVEVAEGISM